MSFILSCDFWFCCGTTNDPECQPPPPYTQPPYTQQQTQVITTLQPPAQLPPHISFDQLPPPPQPAPALPPTIVYNLHPPGTTPSPHVRTNGETYYLPPLKMDQPEWPSRTTPSHLPSSKEYNVPQPMTRQPSCQSTLSNTYDPLPQSSTQIIPSHVPSTKVHEPVMSQPAPQTDHSAIQPSKRYEMPPITNQQSAIPIVPTLVPMHSFTPAPSKVHKPLQQCKEKVRHTDVLDEPPISHITSQSPAQATYPTRQPSKTFEKLPASMNQQSMHPHVPSNRYEIPVTDVAPTHPPVPSKVHDPLAQSKKTVIACVPSTKAHDKPTPAQVWSQSPPQPEWLARQPSKTYQKSASMDQQLPPPHAPSKRYNTPMQAVALTKSLKDVNFSKEHYSEAHQDNFLMDGCQQYY